MALPLLVEAARGAAAAQANSEAHRLAESALHASREAGDAGKPGDKKVKAKASEPAKDKTKAAAKADPKAAGQPAAKPATTGRARLWPARPRRRRFTTTAATST